MKTTVSRAKVWAGLLLLLLIATPVRAEIIQLRDGTLVHGEIVSFDEGVGITVERVDTGGVLSLAWAHLPASEVRRLKASRGFTGEDAELYTVQVTHLLLRNGTTETGLRVDSAGDDTIALQRRGHVDSFPKGQISAVQTGRVEGRLVLTPDELYLRLIDEVGQASDAPSHFALAVACEGAGLLELAQGHYLTTGTLDSQLKVELIRSKLAWLEIKIEDAAETEALGEIRHRLYRKQFALCSELAEAFRLEYPQSRQLGALVELEGDIESTKREFRGQGIVSAYFKRLDRQLTALARDEELTIDVAQEIMETAVHEEIVSGLADEYDMSPETVQELWDARRGGSVRSYNYGTGTFILGKAKALEFGRFDQQGDEQAESLEGSATEEDFDDLVERVKRQRQEQAARRQSSRRGSGSLDDEGLSADEWWLVQPLDEKKRWLSAYYAEASQQLRVIEARSRHCRRCDARGYIEGTDQDGAPIQATCPVCKDLKFERLVRCR
ncbi:MAG: hypothetical protein ACI9EF_001581 [Pseudohongiellaceae bacterium]|jgi:hypothetical protein